jgi:hypothetical protein
MNPIQSIQINDQLVADLSDSLYVPYATSGGNIANFGGLHFLR